MTILRFPSSDQKSRAAALLRSDGCPSKSFGPAVLGVDAAGLSLVRERRLRFLVDERNSESPAVDPGLVFVPAIPAS